MLRGFPQRNAPGLYKVDSSTGKALQKRREIPEPLDNTNRYNPAGPN
jgi:hypothetical protein